MTKDQENCEYCHVEHVILKDNRKQRAYPINHKVGTIISFAGRYIISETDLYEDDADAMVKINNCPMCGRKLADDD